MESLRTEIIVGVIGDQVVLSPVCADGDRLLQKRSGPRLSIADDSTRLLDQPIWLEHYLRIRLFRNDFPTREGTIRLQGFAGVAGSAAVAASQLSVELGGPMVTAVDFDLDIDKGGCTYEEIACDPRCRPGETLGPPPDPALLDTEDEHSATPNDGGPFLLVQSAGDTGDDALAGSLNQPQGVRGGLHESMERDVRGARAGMRRAG